MKRAVLEHARTVAQLLGGLLCAVLGLRVMVLAIGDAQASRVPAAAPASSVPVPETAPAAVKTAPKRAQHVPAPERGHKGKPGDSLRLMLSVLAGPERSEVYVNGSRLGLTPYLGDLSCKQGEQLRIEVVPERSALISRSAICEGRTLLIR